MSTGISFPAITLLVDDDANKSDIKEIMTLAVAHALREIDRHYPFVYRLDSVGKFDLSDTTEWFRLGEES